MDRELKERQLRSFEESTPIGRVVKREREEEQAEWVTQAGSLASSEKPASKPTYRAEDGSTFTARSALRQLRTPTTAEPKNLRSISAETEPSCGSATTASGAAASAPAISPEHAKRLSERGLNPVLCAKLGVHTIDKKTLGFHYFADGAIHNTKMRRGKGDMPWAQSGKKLVLWNLDCLKPDPAPDEEVIITEGEFDAIAYLQAGYTRVVSVPNGAQTGEQGFQFLFGGNAHALDPDVGKFKRYVLSTDGDRRGRDCRDALAVRLSDENCRWVSYPQGCKDANEVLKAHGLEAVRALIENARPMWTDEVGTIDDIPDPPTIEQRFRFGIPELDSHGLRITLPALMVLLGPYSSGKSVLLRQLLCNFWTMHGWRSLLTSFEERVKPRYQFNLRRHFIGRANVPDNPWTADELAAADEQLRRGFTFLRRAKGKRLDQARVLDRVEYAAKVYGARVIAIDPLNEIEMRPPPGIMKTDFIGDFLMALKDLADDYGLLVIVCGHVSKARYSQLTKRGLLTLNDGEDTRHWGGKSDIGWVMWRPDREGPSMLHCERTKDHETMGRPTLAELELDRALGRFSVRRLGYDILRSEGDGR